MLAGKLKASRSSSALLPPISVDRVNSVAASRYGSIRGCCTQCSPVLPCFCHSPSPCNQGNSEALPIIS